MLYKQYKLFTYKCTYVRIFLKHPNGFVIHSSCSRTISTAGRTPFIYRIFAKSFHFTSNCLYVCVFRFFPLEYTRTFKILFVFFSLLASNLIATNTYICYPRKIVRLMHTPNKFFSGTQRLFE